MWPESESPRGADPGAAYLPNRHPRGLKIKPVAEEKRLPLTDCGFTQFRNEPRIKNVQPSCFRLHPTYVKPHHAENTFIGMTGFPKFFFFFLKTPVFRKHMLNLA